MRIGIIGLGKMGGNMAIRLRLRSHEVVGWARTNRAYGEMNAEGVETADSLKELVKSLPSPRLIWMMLPAGPAVDTTVDDLVPLLSRGDILVDGGNSFFKDDRVRFDLLREKGIRFLDAGVSGGIWGLEKGYCLMVGGEKEVFDSVEPVLKDLAPEGGYLYCGPAGAGHFVKMVHNGIEYALMEAYGEGFEILEKSEYNSFFNYHDISKLWNRGSVIRSWLLELLENSFSGDGRLEEVAGYVKDSGEGRWTVLQAAETGANATGIAHSVFKRFSSREPDSFSDKVIAALRNEFGGHGFKSKK